MDDTPEEIGIAIQNVLCRIERRLVELTDAVILSGLATKRGLKYMSELEALSQRTLDPLTYGYEDKRKNGN